MRDYEILTAMASYMSSQTWRPCLEAYTPESESVYNWRSVSPFYYRASIGTPDQILMLCQTITGLVVMGQEGLSVISCPVFVSCHYV